MPSNMHSTSDTRSARPERGNSGQELSESPLRLPPLYYDFA